MRLAQFPIKSTSGLLRLSHSMELVQSGKVREIWRGLHNKTIIRQVFDDTEMSNAGVWYCWHVRILIRNLSTGQVSGAVSLVYIS